MSVVSAEDPDLPAKAGRQIQALVGAALPFELKADVQHWVRLFCHVATSFALHVTLE